MPDETRQTSPTTPSESATMQCRAWDTTPSSHPAIPIPSHLANTDPWMVQDLCSPPKTTSTAGFQGSSPVKNWMFGKGNSITNPMSSFVPGASKLDRARLAGAWIRNNNTGEIAFYQLCDHSSDPHQATASCPLYRWDRRCTIGTTSSTTV